MSSLASLPGVFFFPLIFVYHHVRVHNKREATNLSLLYFSAYCHDHLFDFCLFWSDSPFHPLIYIPTKVSGC